MNEITEGDSLGSKSILSRKSVSTQADKKLDF